MPSNLWTAASISSLRWADVSFFSLRCSVVNGALFFAGSRWRGALAAAMVVCVEGIGVGMCVGERNHARK
jgi:hypothetical protein